MTDAQMMPPILGGSPGTVDKQVAASEDDFMSNDWTDPAADGSLTSSNFVAGNSTLWPHAGSGARFLDIGIPQGSTIDVATLAIQCRLSGYAGQKNTNLKCEDVGNAVAFSDQANYVGRARTATVQPWDTTDEWVADQNYVSPDFAAVVQVVISRGDWVSGNALVVFWEDDDSAANARLIGKSFNASAPNAPLLHIEWSGEPPAGIPIFRRRIEGY